MNKITYFEGDKSKGICSSCEQIVETVFKKTDLHIPEECVMVKGILASFCVHCNDRIGIPAQSTPEIKKQIHAAREADLLPIKGNQQ